LDLTVKGVFQQNLKILNSIFSKNELSLLGLLEFSIEATLEVSGVVPKNILWDGVVFVFWSNIDVDPLTEHLPIEDAVLETKRRHTKMELTRAVLSP
jgi:hypothetical protein